MKLDVSILDTENFYFDKVGANTFIHPKKSKFNWTEAQAPFRSIILNRDNEVVSIGFPKFFNLGENEQHTIQFYRELNSGFPMFFTSKLDGSLIIRSVLDGNVIFRTRGSMGNNTFGELSKKIVVDRYPKLLDPGFEPNHSLLFELIGPSNPIILPYNEDDLILLGRISHENLLMDEYSQLQGFAESNKLKLVTTTLVPNTKSGKELEEFVKAMQGSEGVVVRFAKGQRLIKIKSESYLKMHSLRYHTTYETIRLYVKENKMEECTCDEFLEHLNKNKGYDFEVLSVAKEFFLRFKENFELYKEASKETKKIFTELNEKIKNIAIERTKRKVFAGEISKIKGPIKSSLFMLLDNKFEQAEQNLYDHFLEEKHK